MQEFQWKTYQLTSPKIRQESGTIRFCFLSDLHNSVFGEENCRLIEAIHAHRPDGILVGGDMMISKSPVQFSVPFRLLRELARDYPVWYALGNHEYRLKYTPNRYTGEAYAPYEEELKSAGVHFLHNERDRMAIRGSRFAVYGLELEPDYFRKVLAPSLEVSHIQKLLSSTVPDEEEYSILLAHSPRYGKTYFRWGCDLNLSGHYHGGIWRFSRHYGLAAPQDLLLPRYCCGDFKENGKTLLVSAGLGEHTLPLRINNPREILEIAISRG